MRRLLPSGAPPLGFHAQTLCLCLTPGLIARTTFLDLAAVLPDLTVGTVPFQTGSSLKLFYSTGSFPVCISELGKKQIVICRQTTDEATVLRFETTPGSGIWIRTLGRERQQIPGTSFPQLRGLVLSAHHLKLVVDQATYRHLE